MRASRPSRELWDSGSWRHPSRATCRPPGLELGRETYGLHRRYRRPGRCRDTVISASWLGQEEADLDWWIWRESAPLGRSGGAGVKHFYPLFPSMGQLRHVNGDLSAKSWQGKSLGRVASSGPFIGRTYHGDVGGLVGDSRITSGTATVLRAGRQPTSTSFQFVMWAGSSSLQWFDRRAAQGIVEVGGRGEPDFARYGRGP